MKNFDEFIDESLASSEKYKFIENPWKKFVEKLNDHVIKETKQIFADDFFWVIQRGIGYSKTGGYTGVRLETDDEIVYINKHFYQEFENMVNQKSFTISLYSKEKEKNLREEIEKRKIM